MDEVKRGPGRPRKVKIAPDQHELTAILEKAIEGAFEGTGGLNAIVVRAALENTLQRFPYMWRTAWKDLK